MSEFNKSYRIRTDVGKDKALKVKLDQQYDILEIMSLKIDQKNLYKLHTSNYGVIAGRVLANGGFGIPNAKISVFIGIDNQDMNDIIKSIIYPYNQTSSKDKNNVRYNLLPNEQLNDCHTIIGTFPSKQLVLDNNILLEIFEKYYKFTTKTNESGDYMIFGVPTGVQTIHVDIDLSDVGILSQKPRDMIYKGYNINQFENPNKFKYDTNLNSLAQVISEDTVTEVIPFWGDEEEGTIGITRCDVNVNYKFEPTCVFMGSVVSDSPSNGFSTKCIPTPGMGAMDELTTGSGTIEMIRKTPSGDVEEVQIQGTQLINGDGIWCYQIPMNLDYMKTDEFGKMVPTDDPSKGIATRTRVRFRVSMQDGDNDTANIHRGKILVPHNPTNKSQIDYDFGTNTKDFSYRDLLWNCVYSVKSYIPRIQKGSNWKNEKFTGFKRVNYYNDNNPLPYNNIRIKIPFMYSILCVIINIIIKAIGFINTVIYFFQYIIGWLRHGSGTSFVVVDGTLCNESLENYCIIPGIKMSNNVKGNAKSGLIARTLLRFVSVGGGYIPDSDLLDGESITVRDSKSIEYNNKMKPKQGSMSAYLMGEKNVGAEVYGVVVTNNIDYIIHCIELNLAQEYKVIQFDFYNDWMNGLLYFPRWMRNITKKRTFLFWTIKESKVKGCNESFTKKNINIVQQCGLKYKNKQIQNTVGCKDNNLRCHKSSEVRLTHSIFQQGGGIIHTKQTLQKQNVYYYKPIDDNKTKLYGTDIILLGNLNNCNIYGIPNFFNELISSTYQMPPNMVFTDSDIDGPNVTANSNNGIELYRGMTDQPNNNWFEEGAVTDGGGIIVSEIHFNGNFKSLDENDVGYNTLMSGVDWVYSGPGQSAVQETDLYKPGGHFLGLSCVNSETTIKTCVNVSRICELGVNMSQRKEWETTRESERFGSVPTGFITKDDINDGNSRRIFATLNNQPLQINRETGRYNFITLNPTNFIGELQSKLKSDDNYNRSIGRSGNNGYERVWKPLNDEYTEFKQDEDYYNADYEPRDLIMRTGEDYDDEYYKFRFGNSNGNYIINGEYQKFPQYVNSFYFYFGLHDGKTAVDEFKKQYYGNCTLKEEEEELINFSVTLSDNTQCNGYSIVYATLIELDNNDMPSYESDAKISLEFKTKVTKENQNKSYYGCWDCEELTTTNRIPIISTNDMKEFDKVVIATKVFKGKDVNKILSSGVENNKINVYKDFTNPNLVNIYQFTIKGQKYNCDVKSDNFHVNYMVNSDDFINEYKKLFVYNEDNSINIDQSINALKKQGGYLCINTKYLLDKYEDENNNVISESYDMNNVKISINYTYDNKEYEYYVFDNISWGKVDLLLNNVFGKRNKDQGVVINNDGYLYYIIETGNYMYNEGYDNFYNFDDDKTFKNLKKDKNALDEMDVNDIEENILYICQDKTKYYYKNNQWNELLLGDMFATNENDLRNIPNINKDKIYIVQNNKNILFYQLLDKNDIKYVMYYNSDYPTVPLLVSNNDEESYIYIPVPRGNQTYKLNCYFGNKKKYVSDNFYISNGKDIDFIFNNVRYSKIQPFISEHSENWWEKNDIWSKFSDEDRQNLITTLFVNDINKTYNVNIEIDGIYPPYKEYMYKTLENDDNKIQQPLNVTVNNLLNNENDTYYLYKVEDSIGNTCPKGSTFNFPIIFKPLFIQFGLVYNGMTGKGETTYNIYNGVRSDINNKLKLGYSVTDDNFYDILGGKEIGDIKDYSVSSSYIYSFNGEDKKIKGNITAIKTNNLDLSKGEWFFNNKKIILCEFDSEDKMVQNNGLNYLTFIPYIGNIYDQDSDDFDYLCNNAFFTKDTISKITTTGKTYSNSNGNWEVNLKGSDIIFTPINYSIESSDVNNKIIECYSKYNKNDCVYEFQQYTTGGANTLEVIEKNNKTKVHDNFVLIMRFYDNMNSGLKKVTPPSSNEEYSLYKNANDNVNTTLPPYSNILCYVGRQVNDSNYCYYNNNWWDGVKIEDINPNDFVNVFDNLDDLKSYPNKQSDILYFVIEDNDIMFYCFEEVGEQTYYELKKYGTDYDYIDSRGYGYNINDSDRDNIFKQLYSKTYLEFMDENDNDFNLKVEYIIKGSPIKKQSFIMKG